MTFFYCNRGSITLFLLILLLPMLAFGGLMIDIANSYLAKSTVEGAGELALNSALSNYDTILKEMYGLFAMSQSAEDPPKELNARLIKHFSDTLQSSGLLDIAISDFQALAVSESSLANPEILEKGILEYVKYRGLAEAGMSLLDALSAFEKLNNQTTVTKKKVDVEREIAGTSMSCSEFYKVLCRHDEQVELYRVAEQNLQTGIRALSAITDSESDGYKTAQAAAQSLFQDYVDASPSDIIDYAITEGERLKGNIVRLVQANEDYAAATEKYRQSADGATDLFYITMREESEKYATQFTSDDMDKVLEQLKAGRSYLHSHNAQNLDEYIRLVNTGETYSDLSEHSYLKRMNETFETNAKTIHVPTFYIYLVSLYGDQKQESDPYGDGDSLTKGIQTLDSQVKTETSADEALSYSKDVFVDAPTGSFSEEAVQGEEIEEHKNYGSYEKYNDMSVVVKGLLSVFEEGIVGIRDNLLITEYAVRNFSYLTSAPDQMTMSGSPICPENNRIYGCETEYILFGNKGVDEEKFLWFTMKKAAGPENNIETAKTNIFAARFVFNSIFALTDSEIDRITLAPAMSIQAASGGTFPYQLAQLTIKFALAMGEASLDLKALVNGESIPLLKTRTTWQCSINGMIHALKDEATDAVTGIAKQGINDSIGFIQECIDGTVDTVQDGFDSAITGIAEDMETALTSSIQGCVDSVIKIIKTESEKAFTGIFTEDRFNSEVYIQAIHYEISNLAEGYGTEVQAFLLEIMPFIEETLIKELVYTISKAAEDAADPTSGYTLDQSLYHSVMNKISEQIEAVSDQITGNITDKVNQVTSAAGESLKEYIRSEGDRLSADVEKRLAEKATEVLDRYLPMKETNLDNDSMRSGKSSLSETIIKFSYIDYLRFFMLLKLCSHEREEVLLRIADIIQLNVSMSHAKGDGFRMANAYTYIEISADAKVRSLFFSGWIDLAEGDRKYGAFGGY